MWSWEGLGAGLAEPFDDLCREGAGSFGVPLVILGRVIAERAMVVSQVRHPLTGPPERAELAAE